MKTYKHKLSVPKYRGQCNSPTFFIPGNLNIFLLSFITVLYIFLSKDKSHGSDVNGDTGVNGDNGDTCDVNGDTGDNGYVNGDNGDNGDVCDVNSDDNGDVCNVNGDDDNGCLLYTSDAADE